MRNSRKIYSVGMLIWKSNMEKVGAGYTRWQGSKASSPPSWSLHCLWSKESAPTTGLKVSLRWCGPQSLAGHFLCCFSQDNELRFACRFIMVSMHVTAWQGLIKVHQPTLTTYPGCTPQSEDVMEDPTEVLSIGLFAVWLQRGKICMCELIKE